jgi:molecular chaperone HtpG
LGDDTSDLHVYIEADQKNRTLTVRDNGIGMSSDDVVSFVGTIAKSGTADFLRTVQQSSEQPQADLIAQFGIGFYATFMVADTVTLVTRRVGDPSGTRWQSSGAASYTVESVDEVPVGTSVTLQLKAADSEDGLRDYADPLTVRELITRYSDFIAWPIRMPAIQEAVDAVDAVDTLESADCAADPADSTDGEAQSDLAATATATATAAAPEPVIETVNSRTALWSRSKDEITDEEYRDFYRFITGDWNAALETIHLKAEGALD